jgi:hypothetical protein
MSRPHVFIQANAKQHIGALVSAHSLKRNSARPADFDVTIMVQEDWPIFRQNEGREFLRHGLRHKWINDDLQSFTPLRFLPPQLMAYQGRALVLDPDVFAVGDVWPLLNRDMEGKAILCRRSKVKGGTFATSVMLLDCSKLRHWDLNRELSEMFELKRDYMNWIMLRLENPDTIGLLENEWNDFDRLTESTKLLHNTRRRTQPWKTGLPIDYTPTEDSSIKGRIMRVRRRVFGQYGMLGRYWRHPDHKQEAYFFQLLRECVSQGAISVSQIQAAMASNSIRHDSLKLIAAY